MREIGDVVTQLNRVIVCQTHAHAKKYLGEKVYTQEGAYVGIIVDIFGPIESPYLKIIKKTQVSTQSLYVK
ncbi:MAG: hypothetical protein HXS47_03505 [Theionarchaea archaeon]|nr:hypothetical protein [Theionarchaea archaeon]